MRCLISLWLFIGSASWLYSQQELKIYISADMEGVAGAVTGEQLGPGGFEYERFRRFMTDEVNAVINAAQRFGVGEIVVSDSHGNGQNLLLEELPQDVQVVRAWPRPLGMMEGIDSSFDAVFFVGYHSSTVNPRGVRAHTLSSARLTDVRLAGISMPEAGINAAIAGHFGVPVVMISGDDAIVEEARQLLGDIEAATVKWAYGFHSARTMTPQASVAAIGQATTRALNRIGDFKPYRLATPVDLEVQFKNYRASEILSYLPIVRRINAHAILFQAQDIPEASRFLQFLSHYSPGVSP